MSKNFCLKVLLMLTISCNTVHADVVYISGDRHSVNYISQDNRGNFQHIDNILPLIETAGSYYNNVFAFRHDSHDKILVTRSEQDKLNLAVYDVKNLSTPLANNDISLSELGYVNTCSEFGNNIILAGGAGEYGNVIVEINPSTCEIVGQPYRYSPPGLEDYGDTYRNVFATVHDGKIYAVYFLYLAGGRRSEILVMDKPGNVICALQSPGSFYEPPLLSTGNRLYMSTSDPYTQRPGINPDIITPENFEFFNALGIYRIDSEKLTRDIAAGSSDLRIDDYASRATAGITSTICPDYNGGLYYLVYEFYDAPGYDDGHYYARYVYHWGGARSEKVYDFGEYDTSRYYGLIPYTLSGLDYDVGSETIFAIEYRRLTAIRRDNNGQFERVENFYEASSFAVIASDLATISDDNNSISSGGGGCNSVGIDALIFLWLCLRENQRKNYHAKIFTCAKVIHAIHRKCD